MHANEVLHAIAAASRRAGRGRPPSAGLGQGSTSRPQVDRPREHAAVEPLNAGAPMLTPDRMSRGW